MPIQCSEIYWQLKSTTVTSFTMRRARSIYTALRKTLEPKWLHTLSRFMVCNSAPPVALFWCHFQKWSCFCPKKVWKSATSEGGAIFFLNMIIKEKNGSTLQSGTVFQIFGSNFFLSVCKWEKKLNMIALKKMINGAMLWNYSKYAEDK